MSEAPVFQTVSDRQGRTAASLHRPLWLGLSAFKQMLHLGLRSDRTLETCLRQLNEVSNSSILAARVVAVQSTTQARPDMDQVIDRIHSGPGSSGASSVRVDLRGSRQQGSLQVGSPGMAGLLVSCSDPGWASGQAVINVDGPVR